MSLSHEHENEQKKQYSIPLSCGHTGGMHLFLYQRRTFELTLSPEGVLLSFINLGLDRDMNVMLECAICEHLSPSNIWDDIPPDLRTLYNNFFTSLKGEGGEDTKGKEKEDEDEYAASLPTH